MTKQIKKIKNVIKNISKGNKTNTFSNVAELGVLVNISNLMH